MHQRILTQKANAILCETEAQAVQLATLKAPEWMALNEVNKRYGKEVCGRYMDYSVLETSKAGHDGCLFMLAALRFVKDNRIAWTASWITPFSSSELERGT